MTPPSALDAFPIDEMFARIQQEQFSSYKPTILSQEPWLVHLEAFLSPNEADGFLAALNQTGRRFRPSTVFRKGEQMANVVASGRNSSTAVCNRACLQDARIQTVIKRAKELTGTHYSFPQTVKYERGQYYKPHVDTGEAMGGSATGHRIYTLLLYLSDVEEGGETHFPLIGGAATGAGPRGFLGERQGTYVKPVKGSALLWANVLPNDAEDPDNRMLHGSLPVTSGVKISTNLFSYAYDWHGIGERGCLNVAIKPDEKQKQRRAEQAYLSRRLKGHHADGAMEADGVEKKDEHLNYNLQHIDLDDVEAAPSKYYDTAAYRGSGVPSDTRGTVV